MVKTQTTTIVNNLRGLTNEGFLFWLGVHTDGKTNIYTCVYLYMCVSQKIMHSYTCITESTVLIHVHPGTYFDCCFIELDQSPIPTALFIC